MLGGPNADAEILTGWLEPWQKAYDAVPQADASPRLHPDRKGYYLRAFEAIIGSGQPLDVLWPMMRTWIRAVSLLPDKSEQRGEWREARGQLGLFGAEFKERVAALDAYLDMVEETLDEWGRDSGAEFELEQL